MLERYPVDFDSLSKGEWLSNDALEKAIPVHRNHPSWSLYVVQVCSDIERETGILCCQIKGRVRLMSDQEADHYLARKVKSDVERLIRDSKRTMLIDHSVLDERERRTAEARQRIAVATALAARGTYRKERRLLKAALPEDRLADGVQESEL